MPRKKKPRKLDFAILVREIQENPDETIASICARYGRPKNYPTRLMAKVGDEAYEAAKAEYKRVRDARTGYTAPPGRGNRASDEETQEKLAFFLEAFACGMSSHSAVDATRKKFGSFGYGTVIERITEGRTTYDPSFHERFLVAEATALGHAEGTLQVCARDDWRAAEKLLQARHPHYQRHSTVTVRGSGGSTTTNVFVLRESFRENLQRALSAGGAQYETIDLPALELEAAHVE